MARYLAAAKRALADAGAVFRETAHDAAYDFRDNALRGFGVPGLISSLAGLTVAGVAAAGTASITLEMISKVFGTKECRTCNGWEGLRCTMCQGAGKVQYSIAGLTTAKKVAIENLANAVLEGKEEVIHHPSGYNAGYPLPYKQCPTCNGTGVMKCTECKGFAWKSKFSFNEIMNVPWKTWDAYQKTHPPLEGILENVQDPTLAAQLVFTPDELEGGFKFEEEKQKFMSSFEKRRRYDEIRERVAKRDPGWEQMQDLLYMIEPEWANRDPVIIRDVPYYKARKRIEADVALLQVPPRPAEWTCAVEKKYNLPLSKSYWTDDEQKDPLKITEMKILLDAQDRLLEQVLNEAWATEWRQKKVQEIVHEKVHPYIDGDVEKLTQRETGSKKTPGKSSEESVSGVSRKMSDSKAVPQKVDGSGKADHKKKERQERTGRLAKQAAEREAALSKAKKEPK